MAGNKYDTPFPIEKVKEVTLLYTRLYGETEEWTGTPKQAIKRLADLI